jgi:hypothetical protein
MSVTCGYFQGLVASILGVQAGVRHYDRSVLGCLPNTHVHCAERITAADCLSHIGAGGHWRRTHGGLACAQPSHVRGSGLLAQALSIRVQV